MDRIILIACAVLVVVNLNSEVVLASSPYEVVKSEEEDKYSTPPRLGRNKRNFKDDVYQVTEIKKLADLWNVLGDSPTDVVTINGNDKFVCRNMQGKRDTLELNPRLGRSSIEEQPESEKWLREASGNERSPPFAPRLGRRFSSYPPRFGRDA